MKISLLHPSKRTAIILFALFCSWTLIWGAFYLYAHNDLISSGVWFFPALLLFSAIGAFYLGYRVFFVTDDWYQLNEECKVLWWNNHPRLSYLLNGIGWLLITGVIVKDILQHFYKH